MYYSCFDTRLYLLVGDNASVNSCVANILGVPFIRCMTHTMNLAFKDILTGDDFGVLEDLQLKINSIIAFFNISCISKAQTDIDKATNGYCKTRFGSWTDSIHVVHALRTKIIHFFEHIFEPSRAGRL